MPMPKHVLVTQITRALACASRPEAEQLRARVLQAWPSAQLEIQELQMFPRHQWFVQVWNRTQMGGLAGYVWEYQPQAVEG